MPAQRPGAAQAPNKGEEERSLGGGPGVALCFASTTRTMTLFPDYSFSYGKVMKLLR